MSTVRHGDETTSWFRGRSGAVVRIGSYIALLVAIVATVSAVWGLPSPAEIDAWGSDLGWMAWVLFVPIAVVLKASLFPSPLVSAAAGLLFGELVGTGLVVASSTIAACVELTIGRHVAGEYLQRVLPDKARRYDHFMERKGWLAVMYVRMVPAPHTLINYGAGCTTLRLRHMAVGTMVGSIPLSYAYVSLGGHLGDLFSPRGIVAMLLIVIFAIVGVVLGRMNIEAGDVPAGTADQAT